MIISFSDSGTLLSYLTALEGTQVAVGGPDDSLGGEMGIVHQALDLSPERFLTTLAVRDRMTLAALDVGTCPES